MRIGIVGAGAIGCVVGGMLTKAGHDVVLIDQWPEHVEMIKRRGLKLGGTCGDHLIPVQARHVHEAQALDAPFDAMFVAVKSYDTEWATALAVRHLGPDGVVVDFQNGLNDERVAAVAGRHRTLGCVITIGAGLYEPGHALRTDSSPVGFKIGELDGRETPRAHRLAEVMTAVAPAKITTNLQGERWSKLAVNCMANPLAGLSGLGSAELRTEPQPAQIAVQIAGEVVQVGRACGYEVEPLFGIEAARFVDAAAGRGRDQVLADMAAGARALRGGRPSLLQDVMRGRRTEIDYLNGAVVAEGRRTGVKTPFNEAIVRLFATLGVGFKPDPRHLEPLVRMLPR